MTFVRLRYPGSKADDFLSFGSYYDAEIFVHSIPFLQYVHSDIEFLMIEGATIVQAENLESVLHGEY